MGKMKNYQMDLEQARDATFDALEQYEFLQYKQEQEEETLSKAVFEKLVKQLTK